MIDKQLQQLNFSAVQIQELKRHRQFIIICDGYDESQFKKNIYDTNLFNQPGQWTAKMIISCRSQYLGSDYCARFQPTGDRYQQPMNSLFQEAVFAPFSKTQIEQYVEQFVQKTPSQAVDPDLPRWTIKDYMDKLNKIPKVVLSEDNLSDIRLTHLGLYDNFIEEWLETNKLRLEASILSTEAHETFEALLDEGFVQEGINFQKDLALLSSSTKEATQCATESVESFIDHPLNQRSIVSELAILLFLAERAELHPLFKSRLFAAVEESKADVKVSQAAANAISILVRAGVRFNGADLREIRIPGADIHGGQFDSANMEGADLSNFNMSTAWLRQANLNETHMGGAQFGELLYLTVGAGVVSCVFSSDGVLLAVSTLGSEIIELARAVQGNDVELGDILTGEARVVLKSQSDEIGHIAYSLDGSLIATASKDTTVRVWSTESGETIHILRGHTVSVTGVAFSPT
ncbi:hypothetical protein BGX24_011848 [Mortierella sp. AD032]|nr:hypothetical protein BGX24_011848 [Mortierella sp. AD032]